MTRGEAVQRLRVGYRISNPLQYVSVLDMGRLWERLLRRAQVPMAYTQGYHPHPRLQFAAPLPVGYLSSAEWLDVYLREAVDPDEILPRMRAQCPRGLEIKSAQTVSLNAPVLQAQMREAEYTVQVWSEAEPTEMQGALEALMEQEQILRTRVRKGRQQEYDLRSRIHALAYIGGQPDSDDGVWEHELHLRMRSGSQGSGRPEELLQELELPIDHYRICRTRLIWE